MAEGHPSKKKDAALLQSAPKKDKMIRFTAKDGEVRTVPLSDSVSIPDLQEHLKHGMSIDEAVAMAEGHPSKKKDAALLQSAPKKDKMIRFTAKDGEVRTVPLSDSVSIPDLQEHLKHGMSIDEAVAMAEGHPSEKKEAALLQSAPKKGKMIRFTAKDGEVRTVPFSGRVLVSDLQEHLKHGMSIDEVVAMAEGHPYEKKEAALLQAVP